jgi:predicted RNA binding protein YcfA (HicA-like mRNA interferase family)
LRKKLKDDGWYIDNSSGSHHKFKHPVKPGIVVVAMHNRDIPKGTGNAILKQAGLK